MKVTWNMAIAALVVLGCIVTWSFAQQIAPPRTPPAPGASPAAPAADLPAAGTIPATGDFDVRTPQAQNEDVQTVIEVTPDGGKVLKTYRGAGSRVMLAYPAPHDPDTAKLFAAEEEAAKEAQGLTAKVKSITDEKDKAAATTALREALTRQFDAQQKRRALEVSKIEERLGKLKDTMKKRESAKDTIIGRRLDELTGVTDDLGWEETGGPPRVRSVEARYGEPNYGVPGFAPVPAAPRAFPGGPTEPRR